MRKLKKIFCVFILTASCGSQTAFDATLKSIYKNTVPQIPAKKLYADISTDTSLVFLDAREQKEYVVSHIRNAVFAGYENFDTSFFSQFRNHQKLLSIVLSDTAVKELANDLFSTVFQIYLIFMGEYLIG